MISDYTGMALHDTDNPRTFKFYGYFLNKSGWYYYRKFTDRITNYIYDRNRGNVIVTWELLPKGFVLFKITRLADENDICPNDFNFGEPDTILEELNDFFIDDPIFFGTDWVKMMADAANGKKSSRKDDICVNYEGDSGVGTDVDKKKCMEELEKMAGKDETWKAIYDFIIKIVKS